MGVWITKEITTTGSDGEATGTADINLSYDARIKKGGFVTKIQVDYRSMPATTDVTIRERIPNGSFGDILTLTSQNTDVTKIVQLPSVSPTDVATGLYVFPSVGNIIQVDVAQADAAAPGVVVSVLIE